MKLLATLIVIFLFLPQVTFCQIPADKKVLLNAEGAGQAKYAENNGYPGPKHVLELEQTLNLSANQRKQVQKIFEEMKERATEIGKKIVALEEEFNTRFKERLVTEKSIYSDAEEIGRLRGQLRAVHLQAHLKTKAILTQKQTELYSRIRASEY